MPRKATPPPAARMRCTPRQSSASCVTGRGPCSVGGSVCSPITPSHPPSVFVSPPLRDAHLGTLARKACALNERLGEIGLKREGWEGRGGSHLCAQHSIPKRIAQPPPATPAHPLLPCPTWRRLFAGCEGGSLADGGVRRRGRSIKLSSPRAFLPVERRAKGFKCSRPTTSERAGRTTLHDCAARLRCRLVSFSRELAHVCMEGRAASASGRRRPTCKG